MPKLPAISQRLEPDGRSLDKLVCKGFEGDRLGAVIACTHDFVELNGLGNSDMIRHLNTFATEKLRGIFARSLSEFRKDSKQV